MMNAWEKLVRVLPGVLVALVLVVGLHVTQRQLNHIRTVEKLTMDTPLENAPPVVAFTTVALGGFRGLVADYLWLRSRKMQDEGNYFEMVQLADWIVKLQPRFTGATAFLAWNMSYNISVTFSDFDDRWRWVKRGIELIRDEALQYNPGDPDLYQELAWIYRHKVGQKLDDANRYYKTEMAREIMRIFGGPLPDWERWAEVPAGLDALRARFDEASGLVSALSEAGLDLAGVEADLRATGALPAAVADALAPEVRHRLEDALRARWFVDTYKVEPDIVLALNRKYGELDWRLPQAHAIYWAEKGLDQADQRVHANCERMIGHSLNQAFYEGRLLYVREGDQDYLDLAPNIGVLEATLTRHRQNMDNHPDNTGFRAGFENFLIDAVVVLYTYGEEERAEELRREGRERFGDKFRGPLERFALRQLAQDIGEATQAQASATVRGFLYQACRALAFAEFERAANYEALARRIRERYMAENADTEATRSRRGLPPYAEMKRNTIEYCRQQFPPALVARLNAALSTLGE